MKNNGFLKFILLLGDLILFYISLYLALAIRNLEVPKSSLWQEMIFPFFYLFVFYVFLLLMLGFYEIALAKRKTEVFQDLAIFILLAIVVGTTYFYFQPQLKLTPRAVLVLHVLFFSVFVYLRVFFMSFMLSLRGLKTKVVLAGYIDEADEVLSHMGYDYKLVAVFDPFDKKGSISKVKELEDIVLREKVDLIVFTPELMKNKKVIETIFKHLPLKMKYIDFISFYEMIMAKIPVDILEEKWFLENVSRPEKRLDDLLKRIIDVVFSVVFLSLGLVLFPFIYLAVKLDSKGSVFFFQERMGKESKPFVLYKFRTMTDNDNDLFWREKDEKEITKAGKFLRRFYLDEIPQFLNILKGDMSLVGPRPEWVQLVKMFEEEIPFYSVRHIVRPGITGWAQLNYPASGSLKEAKEKFKYDLYYIKNQSFMLDLSILVKTIKVIFSKNQL